MIVRFWLISLLFSLPMGCGGYMAPCPDAAETDASPSEAGSDTVQVPDAPACPGGALTTSLWLAPSEIMVPAGTAPSVDIPLVGIMAHCDVLVTSASIGLDGLLRSVPRDRFISSAILSVTDQFPSGSYETYLTNGEAVETFPLRFTFWSTAIGPAVLSTGTAGIVSLHLELVPQPAGTRATFQIGATSASALVLDGNLRPGNSSVHLLQTTEPVTVTLVYP